MIVVQHRTSYLPSTKSTITFSSSPSAICPWPTAMRVASGAMSRSLPAHSARFSIRLCTKKTCPPRASSRRTASPSRSLSHRQTKVRMARRSAGGVAMIEISRSPPIAICSVRGIGVAVSVSTSTCVRSSFSRSLCVTPKRCSSSTISSPRSLKRTSRDSRRCVPMTTSTFPCVSACSVPCCSCLVRNRDSAAMRTGKSANRSENVTKCCSASTVVGRQHGDLLAAQHRHQRRPQRDLGLAVADVAADQAIHGDAVLHVADHGVDRLLLIGRLVERERRLERAEGGVGRRERVAGQRRPLRVELQQLLGDLARLGRDALALLLPGARAQLVELDRLQLAAAVPVHQADAVDRQVERPAVVLELQEVLRDAAHLQLLEAAVAADAVLVVDDEVALGDLAQVAQPRRLSGRARLAQRPGAEDLFLGDDDQVVGRQHEPAPQSTRQHRQRRVGTAGEEIVGFRGGRGRRRQTQRPQQTQQAGRRGCGWAPRRGPGAPRPARRGSSRAVAARPPGRSSRR